MYTYVAKKKRKSHNRLVPSCLEKVIFSRWLYIAVQGIVCRAAASGRCSRDRSAAAAAAAAEATEAARIGQTPGRPGSGLGKGEEEGGRARRGGGIGQRPELPRGGGRGQLLGGQVCQV